MYETIAILLLVALLLVSIGVIYLLLIWRPKPKSDLPPGRTTNVWIDPDVCTCDQLCVDECPELLDGKTETGIPKVRACDQATLDRLDEEIRTACEVCPVEAIKLRIEPMHTEHE